jgi:hypothetical protein
LNVYVRFIRIGYSRPKETGGNGIAGTTGERFGLAYAGPQTAATLFPAHISSATQEIASRSDRSVMLCPRLFQGVGKLFDIRRSLGSPYQKPRGGGAKSGNGPEKVLHLRSPSFGWTIVSMQRWMQGEAVWYVTANFSDRH